MSNSEQESEILTLFFLKGKSYTGKKKKQWLNNLECMSEKE